MVPLYVNNDPFAGLKSINKNAVNDEDEIYFGKNKGGKKSKAKNKPSKYTKSTAFSINIDLFDQFGLLNLTPPTNLEAVPLSVEQLKEKKKWYSEQPRGSVPTARDVRKAREEESKKMVARGGEGRGDASGKLKGVEGGGNGGKSNKFEISDDDFVPLGVASSGSVAAPGVDSEGNSMWGRKGEASGKVGA